MPTAQEAMEQATSLLKEGKVQEAHDLLLAKQANPDPPPAPAAPGPEGIVARPVPAWITDVENGAALVSGLFGEFLPLLEGLIVHNGSQPGHVAQLHDLKALHASIAGHGK